MCVAAIISQPVSMEYLQAMDDENPHGAGVAWVANDLLHFRRGLKAKDIHDMQQSGQLTYPYMAHFRWATHGPKVAGLTHPFPTGYRAFLGELYGTASQVLMHNGVWNDFTDWVDICAETVHSRLLEEASDTSILSYIVGTYPDFYEIVDDVPWAVAVATVMDGRISIKTHGRTWLTHEGNKYSNLQWLPNNKWWSNFSYDDKGSGPHYYRMPDYTDKKDYSYLSKMSDAEWEQYLESRYGKRYAKQEPDLSAKLLNELESVAAEQDADGGDGVPLTELVCDLPDDENDNNDNQSSDLITDDPQKVNKWLAATQKVLDKKAG